MTKLPFQKLEVWQKAMVLAKKIYVATKDFPKEEQYGLTSQMRRAVISVASNIAEGSQRSSDKDFANFLAIARGSLAELQTQCIFTQDIHILSEDTAKEIIEQIEELRRMLHAFHGKLTASRQPLPAIFR